MKIARRCRVGGRARREERRGAGADTMMDGDERKADAGITEYVGMVWMDG